MVTRRIKEQFKAKVLRGTKANDVLKGLNGSKTGKLFYDENGLLSGLGNGGIIATVKDTATGTIPALSNLNLINGASLPETLLPGTLLTAGVLS